MASQKGQIVVFLRRALPHPAIHYKEKRAITLEEHQKIIAAEVNPERKTLYQLCWHLGASQCDIANLKGEDVDWLHIFSEHRPNNCQEMFKF